MMDLPLPSADLLARFHLRIEYVEAEIAERRINPRMLPPLEPHEKQQMYYTPALALAREFIMDNLPAAGANAVERSATIGRLISFIVPRIGPEQGLAAIGDPPDAE